MAKKQFAALGVLLAVVIGYWVLSGKTFDGSALRGKRILITGSSSGIGEQTAYEYSKYGTRLFLAARREHLLKQVAEKCLKLGALSADYVVVDFHKEEDNIKVVETAEKVLGGIDHLILDHIVYHKGWWEGNRKNITGLHEAFDVGYFSYVTIVSKALPSLTRNKGNIGVISSIDATFPLGKGGTHTYVKSASKGFFNVLRVEQSYRNTGVSVTMIVLGAIAGGFPKELINYFTYEAGVPEEAARVVVEGVTNREVEVFYPFSCVISLWTHKFFPRWLEHYSFISFTGLTRIGIGHLVE